MLTFAVGLFIASFFVTVAAPNFQFKRGSYRRHQEWDRQRDMRISDLERENNCLKKRLADMENERDWVVPNELDVPPVPPAPPSMPMKSVPSRAR